MQHSLSKKWLAGIMAVLLLAGSLAVLPTAAAGDDGEQALLTATGDPVTADPEEITGTEITFYTDLSTGDAARSYLEYTSRHADTLPKKNIVIDAVNYDPANTTADVKPLSDYEGESSALFMPASGVTSWKVSIPESACYAMRITYFPLTEFEGREVTTYTTIERTLYIDGRVPFSEARYFYFPRTWVYEEGTLNDEGYYVFQTDASGNDVRPLRYEKPTWQTYFLRDWLGYTMDPFQFYLSAGEHVITFAGSRETIVISKIELYTYEKEPTFDEFLAAKQAEGVKIIDKLGDGIIKVQAENPTLISNSCLYPINDRTSALTEPQNPREIRYNIVNSTTVNQWMQYEVEVPETGLYTIGIRYRQNDLIGMFTSRRILVNGEIQFREASNIRFKYDPAWQSSAANNGKQDFLFYLTAGKNEITFETVLGDMTEYVYRIEQMIDRLNETYKTLLKLTGPIPDAYRDYGFNRLVPEAVQNIRDAAKELYEIADTLQEVTGELGDQVATLNTIGMLFERMGDDEYEIAPNFLTFKNYIIALSNWLYASLNQPLKMDYFTIQGQNDPLPKDKANFFEAVGFEISAFVGSWFMDYTTVDFKSDVNYKEENTVTQWITSALGRDDALITRNLVDTYFTPFTAENPEDRITVKMKVITTGLTEAILAGMGPDVAGMTSVDAITWGLRNAVEPLDEMTGFDEVRSWMDEAAIVPYQITNARGEFHTYGLPTTMDFYVMFYRSDVLESLNLGVPKTWTELYAMLPALLSADLQIGMPGTAGVISQMDGLKIFLYQMGGKLYNDGGYSIALDENIALDAFEAFCGMFSKYKSPIQYDFTRFRTGEVPIIIAPAVTTYNTLMTYYDIRGLWKMAPLLGTEQEDGTIDCTSPVTVTGMVIPRGAINPAATWEYLKWTVSPETQRRLARERLMVNANPTTKYNSPTIDALLGQAWTDEEYQAIATQCKDLVGIREYPGNYIVPTYVTAAFMEVYSSSADASDEMLDQIGSINKEISRKRADFKMDFFDAITGEYHAGRYISEPNYYE